MIALVAVVVVVGFGLQPFIGSGDVSAIVAFTAGSNFLSQMTSDTASAGVMIPLVIKAFANWHGLQYFELYTVDCGLRPRKLWMI